MEGQVRHLLACQMCECHLAAQGLGPSDGDFSRDELPRRRMIHPLPRYPSIHMNSSMLMSEGEGDRPSFPFPPVPD
jgi:hypothetical protein